MISTTALTAPPTAQPTPQAATRPAIWKTGAMAGLAAAVGTTAFAAVAHAIDVPLKVAGQSIPLVAFAQLTLIASIIGTVLAMVLSRRSRQPRRTFLLTTITLTVASFIPDVLADAPSATKVTLVLSHVVAATIVIPALATRLTD